MVVTVRVVNVETDKDVVHEPEMTVAKAIKMAEVTKPVYVLVNGKEVEMDSLVPDGAKVVVIPKSITNG